MSEKKENELTSQNLIKNTTNKVAIFLSQLTGNERRRRIKLQELRDELESQSRASRSKLHKPEKIHSKEVSKINMVMPESENTSKLVSEVRSQIK